VVLVRDVTREREVDRMKTDFIATVSHELRTPLTSVLGFAKLARTKLDLLLPLVPEGDKKLQRAAQQVTGNLEIISSEGSRLADLINDVLDISKMEAGRVDWREDVIRVPELVDRAIAATSGLFADASPVQRLRRVDDDLPFVVGDPQRLLQVLINLISNASKFTREGTITLAARRVTGGVELSVEDTGPGIPAKDHALIFERFRQSSSDTLTDKPKGTGLGLAISKHIVEHHGGRIWVESEVGRGSRFALVLPVQEPSKPELMPRDEVLTTLLARMEELFPHENLRRGADVLVVDDDDSARELLVQVLTDAGHKVRTAKDGVTAVAEIRHRRPELLVLDVVMPGLTGFDVAAMVRADPETHGVPILVISVLTDPDRGVRLGVDRYLTKPVLGTDLVPVVESLLRRAELPRRVLVVDPIPENAQRVRAVLESERCTVVGTCSVGEALPQARALLPDLVVVGTSAIGLVEALRDDAALQTVAVIELVS
jgi:CheY-like chemotaxis protein/nitrogen-specific signal transduction histidine kinase